MSIKTREYFGEHRTPAMLLNDLAQKSEMGEKSSSQQPHPVDKGRKAWTFLAAASATNIITYGEDL